MLLSSFAGNPKHLGPRETGQCNTCRRFSFSFPVPTLKQDPTLQNCYKIAGSKSLYGTWSALFEFGRARIKLYENQITAKRNIAKPLKLKRYHHTAKSIWQDLCRMQNAHSQSYNKYGSKNLKAKKTLLHKTSPAHPTRYPSSCVCVCVAGNIFTCLLLFRIISYLPDKTQNLYKKNLAVSQVFQSAPAWTPNSFSKARKGEAV